MDVVALASCKGRIGWQARGCMTVGPALGAALGSRLLDENGCMRPQWPLYFLQCRNASIVAPEFPQA